METGIEIFTGDSEHYHRFRVSPPEILIDLVTTLLGDERPKRVVDLGCGTGLSTFVWDGHADEIIGVEPNAEMRKQAEDERTQLGGRVRFLEGDHAHIDVADESVDVVTCCQSLHWMNPVETHLEILRVLRKGGLLAAYAYDMPPTVHPAIQTAFYNSQDKAREMIASKKLWPNLKAWPMAEHLTFMQKEANYRTTRQLYFHQQKKGTATDFVELAKSYGHIDRALKKGVSEGDLGLSELLDTAREIWRDDAVEWIFGYRMIVGIK